MITTLLAALALADAYDGFRARLQPFGAGGLHRSNVAMLDESGYDMTSLLYQGRSRIVAILNLAQVPAAFNTRDVNFFVRYKGKAWAVDASGTVQCGRSSLRLDRDQFQALRDEIRLALPQLARPEDEIPPSSPK